MFLVLLPLLTRNGYVLHLLILCFIFGVAVTSWDLTIGYTGIFNFAHFAFFSIGAYTSAILAKSAGVLPWLSLPVAGLVAAAASLVLSLPTLRLKGIYFALFSFAFVKVVYSLILFNPGGLTGGAQGLVGVPSFSIGSFEFSHVDKTAYYYLGLALFGISTYAIYRVIRSPVGLSLQALRDSEAYAVGRGISAYVYKVSAVAISAFFAGLIGAFYGNYLGVVGLETMGWEILSLGLAMLVLGGVATLFGPIISVFLLTVGFELLRQSTPGFQYLAIAIVMISIVVLAPFGIGGIAGLRASPASE
jgi:branched-chain amino acid transport system permease protein